MATLSSESLLILLSAPSGGGKTTLCERLLATTSETIRAVTCTTRAPRSGEQHGIDYYFIQAPDFEAKIAAGEFLEHAIVHGNQYGILRSEVLTKLSQGKDVLLNVDVQGAATIRRRAESDPELAGALITVFITPPSIRVLEERLKKRGQNAAGDMERRLSVAREEIARWTEYDYLIVSGSIEEDLRRMQAILLAEKMRRCRARPPEF